MLNVNLASMQPASLSHPVTFDRKSSTEADTTPSPSMMPAYHYPVMYNNMTHVQPGFAPMLQTAMSMPMQQPGMATRAASAPLSPANMAISPTLQPMNLQYTYSSEALYQMAQAGTPIVPSPAQPHTYPQQAVISVKPADQMNVLETFHWVKLIGEVQGWSEATTYAQNFYNNGVTGVMLAQLTIEDLEKYLGVEKHGHRLALMSSIQAVYPHVDRSGFSTAAPSTTAESTCGSESETQEEGLVRPELRMVNSGRRRSILVTESLSQRNLLSHDKNLESIQLKRPQLIDESSCTSVTSNNSMASYLSASSQATDTTVSSSINGDRRCQLTLTLKKAPECNREAMLAIRQTFSTAGFDAHPRPSISERVSAKFIVRFQSEAEANRALSLKEELGYDLSDYTESRKKGPRPTPSNPQQYMVLHHARMRSGKSMKSQVLGFVEKGEVFWVNQIKGKRARLIKRTQEGDKNLGWVSLRNNAGYQLMAPFHE